MLCAKYDYKTDIAVKQEEAREEKALEDALLLINKYGIKPEVAAQDMKVELDKLLAALNAQPAKA